MSEYTPTIGLEIHAELKTRTKMFCNSKNDPDETRANVNICPVCLAHPGALPVVNREAVRHVLRVGVALGGTLAGYTEFDRKNYFYPDLPKGYQISQYEFPLVSKGALSGVEITRIHLEEDTASSIHEEGIGTSIDYNRAGVPLMELVTEPVIHSAEKAGSFARELQILLRYLGASDANMEKGEMRVEANVSVAKATDTADTRRTNAEGRGKSSILRNSASSLRQSAVPLGTKVEIKNLNSFRAMERAVEFEIKRQTALLERGEFVVQETRGWDEKKQATFPQRIKEGSADYRYFPDPDIPSFRLSEVSEFSLEALLKDMPELPWQRRERYLGLGIKGDDADLFVREPSLGAFFDDVTKDMDIERVKLTANYIANDLVSLISSGPASPKATQGKRDTDKRETEISYEIPISAQNFRKIIELIASVKISSRSAKDLISFSMTDKRDPEEIAKENNLFQESNIEHIQQVIDDIVAKNASVAADYKAGKLAALEYLVGQGMKALRGSGNPQMLRDLIKKKLG
ncbi:MAG: Asp-tRNA(Asn)/Glu-tRNA(Gln) amidotransferase subunit GatB [bacterium]|nr:Asp-tRNA(Asn)/Glu-tRNA(Gln) amidotransferase subunit GatB [bacterium]